MSHKKKKYNSGNMPFEIYSSSVNTGYGATIASEMGIPATSSSVGFSTAYDVPLASNSYIGNVLYIGDGTSFGGDCSSTDKIFTASMNPYDESSVGDMVHFSSAQILWGTAFDNVNQKVYWSYCPSGNSQIWSSSFDGSNQGLVLDLGSGDNIYALAVSPENNRLIFGKYSRYIYTASLDGEDMGQVFFDGASTTLERNIVWSKSTQKMFFKGSGFLVDGGNKLWSASLDGGDSGPIFDDGLEGTRESLAIDDVNQRLWYNCLVGSTTYWYTSSYDGTTSGVAGLVATFAAGSQDKIRGLVIDPHKNKLYFGDAGSGECKLASASLDDVQTTAGKVDTGVNINSAQMCLSFKEETFSAPYQPGAGFDITNLHEDTYGGIKGAPMQGPFTYQYVGGNQHRHVPVNKGHDTWYNRPELFHTSFSSSGEIKVIGQGDSSVVPPIVAGEILTTSSTDMCVSVDGIGEKVYLGVNTTSDYILRCNLDGSGPEVIYPALGGTIKGIAIEPGANKVWWCDSSADEILRGDMDGSGPVEVIIDIDAGQTPVDICLDPGNRKLYYTDDQSGAECVRHASMDPSGPDFVPAVLISTPGQELIGIDIDIPRQRLYYCTKDEGIYRFSLAPNASPELIVPVDFNGVTGAEFSDVAVDSYSGFIYFTDEANDQIWRANLDGTGREELVDVGTGDNMRRISLDLPRGKMYWTDAPGETVMSSSMIPWVPLVPYTRGDVAKRPVNIANHKTYNPLGNFTYDYEVVQTVGRTSNNRAFVEAEGVGFIGDPTRPYSGSLITQFVSGARAPLTGTALPTFLREETVFVNHFNAPGGTDVSSRGVLDTYAEEYAPNNALPWRNNAVRSVLRSDLARHTPNASDIPPLIPTKYHTDYRNPKRKLPTPSDSIELVNTINDGGSTAIHGFSISPPTGPLPRLAQGRDLYLMETNGDEIWRMPNLPEGGTSEVIFSGVSGNGTFALLWEEGEKIYFNDAATIGGTCTLKRIDLDGSSVETMISDSLLGFTAGFAIDPSDEKIYWMETTGAPPNGNYAIKRAGLNIPDGFTFETRTDIETLVTVTGVSGGGMSLDLVNGKMYWHQYTLNYPAFGETYNNAIWRANLDGTGVEQVYIDPHVNAQIRNIEIDAPGKRIYFTVDPSQGIWSIPLQSTPLAYGFNETSGNWKYIAEKVIDTSEIPDGDIPPAGLRIDSDRHKIYWVTDSSNPTNIYRADLPELSSYDNAYVTHAIPRCSLDYSWINASALTTKYELPGYQSSGSY